MDEKQGYGVKVQSSMATGMESTLLVTGEIVHNMNDKNMYGAILFDLSVVSFDK